MGKDWLTLALIGLGVWHFFIRKPAEAAPPEEGPPGEGVPQIQFLSQSWL